MEAAGLSEQLATFYQIAQIYEPEDVSLYNHSRVDPPSNLAKFLTLREFGK